MNQNRSCPQCGALLSATTLEGLCPACAADMVLALASGEGPGPGLTESGAQRRATGPIDFGDFELLEEIARGGMGVVYRARQKSLNRLVALKMILSGRFAGEEPVRRFRAEAEAAARLRHPGIVAIHEVGEIQGQSYFSMDLIEGPSLADLVRENPLSHHHAARLVGEVARAVQYAHERGVVHRDLKPSNIIIDSAGRPHISDFGLAKRMDIDSDLTRSGQVLGSPGFAAPEQAGGTNHSTGPLTDVYALGALLYYLLVGRPPFLAESLEQTLAQVLGSDPWPPRKLDPGVPCDLETISLKCLEKDPSRRYPSAGDLADELERYLLGQPIRARPVGLLGRGRRWCRRQPALAGMTVVVVTAIVLGFLGVLSQWRRAEALARSETAERGRAQEALHQLEWQRADDLLENGRPAEALTLLAHMRRTRPRDPAVAARIQSVLSQCSWPLPAAPPLRHEGPVLTLDFSPDGTRLVSASWDHTARIWDTESGRAATRPLRHNGEVATARFSSDNRRVVTAGRDHTAQVWDGRTGEPLTPPLPHEGPVISARFSPDGTRVVTGSEDRTARIWSAQTGQPLGRPIQHGSRLVDAFFSPDGRNVLSASVRDGLALISDADSGTVRRRFNTGARITSARYSPDGQHIAIASSAGFARILDADSGVTVATLRRRGSINDAVFSPDGELLATVSSDRSVLLWDARTGALLSELVGHQTAVESAEFTPDGLRLLTHETGDKAILWDVLTGQPVGPPIQASSLLYEARFSPDGQQAAVAGIDGTIQFWTVAPGRAEPLVLVHSTNVVAVAASRDGKTIAGGYADGQLIVWNGSTGQAEKILAHAKSVLSVEFSPDESRILTVSADDLATVWEIQSGNKVAVRERSVRLARFSPDGRSFLTATSDGRLRTWSTTTGEAVLGKPILHGSTIWQAEFSPDGRLIATAHGNYTACLWDAQSGEPRSRPLEHRRGVRWVSFDPRGERLVTASRDHTAAVWAVKSGRKLFELAHDGQLRSACFSPDGRRVLTASYDNTARLWDAETGALVAAPLRHQAEVQYAEFSPDSRWVATASLDGMARVWDAKSGRPVTEPLRHSGEVFLTAFTADGRRLVTGGRLIRIWELPRLAPPAPEWLAELAEGLAGPSAGASDHFWALRRKLHHDLPADPWNRWARWLVADRSTRMLSASQSVTAREMAIRMSRDDSVEGCVELIRLEPTNGLAWARLALRTRDPLEADDPRRSQQAVLYSRRATKLSPHDPHVWLVHARILRETRSPEEALTVLSRGVILHPKHEPLWQARAELHGQLGHFEEAYADYTRLVGFARDEGRRPAPVLLRRRREIGVQMNRAEDAQRDWLRAATIPARPPDMPPGCIDLSPVYNAALDEAWHDRSRPGNDLSQISPGLFMAAGIAFDVRGIVQTAGTMLNQVEPGYPSAVNQIAVNQSGTRVHFLHAAGWGQAVPDDTIIGRYVVHFADGRTESIALRKNLNLHEWFQNQPRLDSLKDAQIIPLGRNAARAPVRLFLMTWRNPSPSVPIAGIDFVSELTAAAPFLVALTVER